MPSGQSGSLSKARNTRLKLAVLPLNRLASGLHNYDYGALEKKMDRDQMWEKMNRDQRIRYVTALGRVTTLAEKRVSNIDRISKLAGNDDLRRMVLMRYDRYLSDGSNAAKKLLMQKVMGIEQ